MGEEIQGTERDSDELRRFTQHLLIDIRALEKMIEDGMIESDITRVGAEQEIFLVDGHWRPALVGPEVLAELEDERFTSELGRFNLEFNLDPAEFTGNCMSELQGQLVGLLEEAEVAAHKYDAEILLCGILPTLLKSDLSLDSMTPRNRYYALNDAMKQLRGEHFRFRIKGRDELIVSHDNVMFEACNTSFQVHLQVSAETFAQQYNIAQLISAPVLAAAVNSPLLFGRRLWAETRIALFQQSVDTRRPDMLEHRSEEPRVSFGRNWLQKSVVEIFKEDVARFRVVLGADREENSLEVLQAGGVPRLAALCLHNGTVYRWNRPCYGISEGKPHLRIENRLLPAGPSVPDAVANATFWLGLMIGGLEEYGDVASSISFDAVRDNFIAAARLGMRAQVAWPGRDRTPVGQLILEELLPLAKQGLDKRGVDEADSEYYLGIIRRRVETGRTGARWQVVSLDGIAGDGTSGEVMSALVASMHEQQVSAKPVHEWEAPELHSTRFLKGHYRTVGQLMTTDLFTVNETEPIDLAAHLMDWRHVRHVPVEDRDNKLVGLVSHRALLRLMALALTEGLDRPMLIGEIMEREVVTVKPDTPTISAMTAMREHKVSCLPVVDDAGLLVGIITERDFMGISGELLERFLEEE